MHVKCVADSLAHLISVSCYANGRDEADYEWGFFHPGGYVHLPSSGELWLAFFQVWWTSSPAVRKEAVVCQTKKVKIDPQGQVIIIISRDVVFLMI